MSVVALIWRLLWKTVVTLLAIAFLFITYTHLVDTRADSGKKIQQYEQLRHQAQKKLITLDSEYFYKDISKTKTEYTFSFKYLDKNNQSSTGKVRTLYLPEDFNNIPLYVLNDDPSIYALDIEYSILERTKHHKHNILTAWFALIVIFICGVFGIEYLWWPRNNTSNADPDPLGIDTNQTLKIKKSLALSGGQVDIKTARSTLKLTIPPNSANGTKLRLKGQGLVSSFDDRVFGDAYVTLKVTSAIFTLRTFILINAVAGLLALAFYAVTGLMNSTTTAPAANNLAQEQFTQEQEALTRTISQNKSAIIQEQRELLNLFKVITFNESHQNAEKNLTVDIKVDRDNYFQPRHPNGYQFNININNKNDFDIGTLRIKINSSDERLHNNNILVSEDSDIISIQDIPARKTVHTVKYAFADNEYGLNKPSFRSSIHSLHSTDGQKFLSATELDHFYKQRQRILDNIQRYTQNQEAAESRLSALQQQTAR